MPVVSGGAGVGPPAHAPTTSSFCRGWSKRTADSDDRAALLTCVLSGGYAACPHFTPFSPTGSLSTRTRGVGQKKGRFEQASTALAHSSPATPNAWCKSRPRSWRNGQYTHRLQHPLGHARAESGELSTRGRRAKHASLAQAPRMRQRQRARAVAHTECVDKRAGTRNTSSRHSEPRAQVGKPWDRTGNTATIQ